MLPQELRIPFGMIVAAPRMYCGSLILLGIGTKARSLSTFHARAHPKIEVEAEDAVAARNPDQAGQAVARALTVERRQSGTRSIIIVPLRGRTPASKREA